MFECHFKVRDLYKKEQFIVDDAYLDGYAKLVGPYATCVYLSLCRHADGEQKAFPSIKRIAQEFGISTFVVKKGIKELIKWNLIIKRRLGKRLSNEYWLLDKSEWKPKPDSVMAVTQPSQSNGSITTKVMEVRQPNDGSVTTTKDTQGNDSHKKEKLKQIRKQLEIKGVLTPRVRTSDERITTHHQP